MLSDKVRELRELNLKKTNEIANDIAKILVVEKFSMEDLSEVELVIIEMASQRIEEVKRLHPDLPEIDPLSALALVAELSLYIGIKVGMDFSADREEEHLGRISAALELITNTRNIQ